MTKATSPTGPLNEYLARKEAEIMQRKGGKPLTEEDLIQLQILEYEFANPPRSPFIVEIRKR